MTPERTAYTVEPDTTVQSLEPEYEGKTARQAALKLARDLPEAESESDAKSDPETVTLRSVASGAEFVFEACAWSEDPSTDNEWAPDDVTEVALTANAIDDPHEWFADPHEADQWERDS